MNDFLSGGERQRLPALVAARVYGLSLSTEHGGPACDVTLDSGRSATSAHARTPPFFYFMRLSLSRGGGYEAGEATGALGQPCWLDISAKISSHAAIASSYDNFQNSLLSVYPIRFRTYIVFFFFSIPKCI